MSENDSQQVDELRQRLDRRNELLDIIRKAYHRDVIVVREYLLHLQNSGVSLEEALAVGGPGSAEFESGGSNSDVTDIDLDLHLRSIPSIDLRNEGFHLYAPEECELNIKPCHYCGGRLEITHHECSRIMDLMASCNELKNREREVVAKLEDAYRKIDDGKDVIVQHEQDCVGRQELLRKEIERLKGCVADRDELEAICNEQKRKIETLEIIRREKEKLDEVLEQTNSKLSSKSSECDEAHERIASLEESNVFFSKQCNDRDVHIQRLENEVKDIKSSNTNLKQTVGTLEELESQLKGEIKTCKGEIQRREDVIETTRAQKKKLERILTNTKLDRDKTIKTLDRNLKDANQIMSKLQGDFTTEKEAAMSYRHEMALEMKRRQQLEEDRATKDQQVNETLTKQVKDLLTLTSSYIQGLYDQCLTQEQMLLTEGGLGSIPVVHAKKNQSSTSQQYLPVNTKQGKAIAIHKHLDPMRLIDAKLVQRMDSIHLDWKSMLEDESNRRKVFGNLNNRTQVNLGHIQKLIQRLHLRHANELKKRDEQNEKIIKNHRISCNKEIQQLESREEEMLAKLEDVSNAYNSTKAKLTDAISNIEARKVEKIQSDETISHLEERVSKMGQQLALLRNNLSDTKKGLGQSQSLLEQKEADIADREGTLEELEQLLQKSTERYVRKMEEDRMRLETNVTIGIQVIPSMKDGDTQVDFVQPVAFRNGIVLANAANRDRDRTRQQRFGKDPSVIPTASQFLEFEDPSVSIH